MMFSGQGENDLTIAMKHVGIMKKSWRKIHLFTLVTEPFG